MYILNLAFCFGCNDAINVGAVFSPHSFDANLSYFYMLSSGR